jgi:CBS domain-containing protein
MKRKRLVGIITLKDLLSAGYVRLEREDERGGRGVYPPNVEKVMKTPVMTVVSDSTIWEAANLMRQYEIGRLPVVEDRKLIGIIDRQDLVKVII